MHTKTRFGLAILAAALLVLNPIVACASMPGTSSAHRCCPRVPAMSADCAGPGCVCVNSTPIPAQILPDSDDVLPLALPASADRNVSPIAANERPTFATILFAPLDRYLSFHQLLL